MTRRDWIVCLSLAAVTLALYWRTTGYPFISYDDDVYVTENPHVQQGLTPSSIAWAFTTGHGANWHPLTWLSHMLDWQFFGARAGGHHFTSILIHAINGALLYFVLARFTQSTWCSAAVAALFALHPLHVESVAWVAERKDVLSTFFMLLALLAYERYARTRQLKWYAMLACAFAVGLLCKPMIVTLPVLLLLLDYWPLHRLTWRALLEKLPLFALTIASGITTFLVQRAGGAVRSFEHVPFSLRVANAFASYVRYLAKTFYPFDLAVFYPMQPAASRCALALLFIITGVAIVLYRRMPWLLVGWLWYLVTLTPVIGIIQVGDQSMADRYTYIPLIGIFIALAWTIGALVGDRRPPVPALTAAICAIVAIALVFLTHRQITWWRDSETLFAHTAAVTKDNWLAYNHLATALEERKQYDRALEMSARALRIHPAAVTHFNHGNVLRKLRRLDEARQHYEQAIALNPNDPVARSNLAVTLAELNRPAEAESLLRETIQRFPNHAVAHANLGSVLLAQGRTAEAIAAYKDALRIDPNNALARTWLQRLGQPLP